MRSSSRFYFPLVVILLAGTCFQAQAAVLCTQKKGTGPLFVREACKKNETLIDPATLGLQAKEPAVYDATGKKVGNIVEVNQDSPFKIVYLLLKVAQTSFFVGVNHDKFLSQVNRTYSGNLYFTSPDCSGTPLLPPLAQQSTSSDYDLLPNVAVGPPGNTVYVPDILATPQFCTVNSVISGVTSECSAPPSESRYLVPADALVDLYTLFTPPFSIH